MKIVFFWQKFHDRWDPHCRMDLADESKFSQLECLLMDDGGTGISNSASWIKECLEKILLIETHELESYCWLREGWEADLSTQGARIYNGYEPQNFEIYELQEFKKILLAWQNFIQSMPQSETNLEIEI